MGVRGDVKGREVVGWWEGYIDEWFSLKGESNKGKWEIFVQGGGGGGGICIMVLGHITIFIYIIHVLPL